MTDLPTIERFEHYILAVSRGPDAALAELADQMDPESLRWRAKLLLDLGNHAAALQLLGGKPLDIEWTEQLVRAQVRSGLLADARDVIEWTRTTESAVRFLRASAIAATEALDVLFASDRDFSELPLLNLSANEQSTLAFCRTVTVPIATELLQAGTATTNLDRLICATALRVVAALGEHDTLTLLGKGAAALTPIPMEVGYLANAGLLEPERGWSDRIRRDHQTTTAHVVAGILETRHFGRARFVFEQLLARIESTEDEGSKHNLYFGLHETAQYLGESEVQVVKALATRLLGDSRQLIAFTDAEAALLAGQTSVAEKLLQDWEDPTDPVWVQLFAQVLMQKKHLSEAATLLSGFADKRPSPAILNLLAQISFSAERLDVAKKALSTLVLMRPADVSAKRNLALTLLRLDDNPNALPILEELTEKDPANERDALLFAQCLIDLNDTATAASFLSAFVSRRPTSRDARLLLAYAHEAAGNPQDAFQTLRSIQDAYQEDPQFQFAYFEAASRAGRDSDAHDAMQALVKLRATGKVPEEALTQVAVSDIVEMATSFHANVEKAGVEYLHGKLPWLSIAELERSPVLWAWFMRTQKLPWLAEIPTNVASHSIYSTNSFTVLKAERKLVDIQAAPLGTTIALDISALVTVWELGLFEMLASSYSRILLPSPYLERAAKDKPRLLPHQLSQSTTVLEIQAALDAKKIRVMNDAEGCSLSRLSEYEDDDTAFRIANVLNSLRDAGILTKIESERLSRIAHKAPHPGPLARYIPLLAEVHTLRTITSEGLLDRFTEHWSVSISDQARIEIADTIRAFEAQTKIRASHDQLWTAVRTESAISLVPPRAALSQAEVITTDKTAVLGVAVALESDVPLLADDRSVQQVALNAKGASETAAFGTDQWLTSLHAAKRIDDATVAKAFLSLMEWRYKFLVPAKEILLAIAEQFPDVVPNLGLITVSKYLHACMRDPGLYSALEPVDPPVSVAVRLYLRWMSELARFLVTVWGTPKYTPDYAQRLTNWLIREAIPGPPQSLGSGIGAQLAWDTKRYFFKHFAAASFAVGDSERMKQGFSSVHSALGLTDAEYLDCLAEVLSHGRA